MVFIVFLYECVDTISEAIDSRGPNFTVWEFWNTVDLQVLQFQNWQEIGRIYVQEIFT